MSKDFRDQQREFAAHLRDPESNAAPEGIEDRRLAIYRNLFFNNIRSLLAATFPVLCRILGDDRWSTLVRDFYRNHVSVTPLFLEVPREFLEWLAKEFEDDGSWPGFLYELAHYEWVELDVSVDPAKFDAGADEGDGNILESVPVLSPLARVLAYRWPVHRIGPGFQPTEPGSRPTFLVVHRNRADEVGFIEVNGPTARLLEMAGSNEQHTGRELLEQLGREMNDTSGNLLRVGERLLHDLERQSLVFRARS